MHLSSVICKKKTRVLTIWADVLMNNVPFSSHLLVSTTSASSHGSCMYLNNVTVVLYITLSGWKTKHAVCSWPARDTLSHYGAVRLSHTALSVEVTAWLTAPRGIRCVFEQYQAVMFDVHSLRLDLFKSLCSEAPVEMGFTLQVSVSLCLWSKSSIYSI